MTTVPSKKQVPIIAVVGFTASGKSAFGMQLAKDFNGEIIAADSMTIYQGFDIGTAKPTQKEQLEVQHHLLDIAEASSGFSAAKFKQCTEKIIADISARGKLPILVGGSGLYVDSILFDYEFRAAPIDMKMRAELDVKTPNELLAIARARGLNIKNIDVHNKRRIIRLIESGNDIPASKPLRENTLVLGIDVPREKLRGRVEARVDSMIEQGLEEEVERLGSQYGWDVEPMRSIGYREWRGYFDGAETLNDVKKAIIVHTMQLAKKQQTWFKRNPSIEWVNNFNEAVEYTTTFLNK